MKSGSGKPTPRIKESRPPRTRSSGTRVGEKIFAGKTNAVRRFRRNFRWDGIALEPYKLGMAANEFSGASRQVLIGNKGEPVKFHLRYFELEPEGFTSLERHRHCHVVIPARGYGFVSLNGSRRRVAPMDLIYIGPNVPHQLSAPRDSVFGFFCIVDAKRDRPRPVR
jgi:quercetin dioxygenase-like cupin family protein